MNNSLNEYLRFNFELNIELNHFLARFNVNMNNQNLSLTPTLTSQRNFYSTMYTLYTELAYDRLDNSLYPLGQLKLRWSPKILDLKDWVVRTDVRTTGQKMWQQQPHPYMCTEQ